MRLCAGGDLLTQLLITQPELLASLADPAALERPRTRSRLRAALAPVFAPGLTAADRRDSLRRLKQAEELTIVWRYLLGATSIDGYSRDAFLAEVRYVANADATFQTLDPDLGARLSTAFAAHPWVAGVESVVVEPPNVVTVGSRIVGVNGFLRKNIPHSRGVPVSSIEPELNSTFVSG